MRLKGYIILLLCILLSLASALAETDHKLVEDTNNLEILQEEKLSSNKILLVKKADEDYPFLRIVDKDGVSFDSSPLPKDTYIEWAESESIALFANYQHIYIKRSDRFQWALVGINDFEFGYDFVYGGNFFYSNVGYCYGDHVYGRSISDVNFLDLPASKREMIESLNQDGWGHVLCAESATLYNSPNITSSKFVELYNGTPCKIVSEKGGWLQIRIGDSLYGFISKEDIKMTGYIEEDESDFPELYFSQYAILYSEPNLESEQRCRATNIEDLVMGKVSDEWFLVVTLDGMTGYINVNDLINQK